MNGLLSMIGMKTEMEYQMSDFPFGLPSFRFNVPKGSFPSERYDTLDKKVWKKIDGVKWEDGYYVAIAPNKRYKQGKVIASVLLSYKSVANHFKVMKELNIEVPQASRFSITQLLRHKDRIFVFFDDSIRAEKHNSDFKEITIGEYEDFINSKD